MMAVMLTPAEMAEAAEGEWENLTPDLAIGKVEYIFHYLGAGDLYVVRRKKWHKIQEAVSQKKVAALLLDRTCDVDVSIPVLRVERVYTALRRIALLSSERSNARRILVTGSYGKTGFKNHLHTCIGDQRRTACRESSANKVMSTYVNLASLKPEDELLVIEQPVSTRTKTARRARYVRPDVCVITSIGHEHIERFGSVENIVTNKTQIAGALRPGGICIIPHEDAHYALLKKALRKFPHVDVRTFGTAGRCHARLLYSRYRDFGWDVLARIETEYVAYRVPFPETHEPVASLAVLLSVYHLGGDVHRAAARFYTCRNFKSSGILYHVAYKGKQFYLYDQSHRGGIEGYARFFTTLSRLRPEGSGRKIVLTSAFVDDADGEIALVDRSDFKTLMADAGIDLLYTVEHFKAHADVVPENVRWVRHSDDFHDLRKEILSSLRMGDLLCVKGIFESALPGFVRWLAARRGLTMRELDRSDGMRDMREALRGLRSLAISERERFCAAVEAAGKRNRLSFFPFLLMWGSSPGRDLLYEEHDGAVLIYLLSRFGRDAPPGLELLMPPMPLNPDALRRASARLRAYGTTSGERIAWVEEDERGHLEAVQTGWTWQTRETVDLLYDPADMPTPEMLPETLRKLESEGRIEVADYDARYKEQCAALLERNATLGTMQPASRNDRYARRCLDEVGRYDTEALFGIVILVDGEPRAFGFAGKIRREVACAFVGTSDPGLDGLSDYLRLGLFRRLAGYGRVNDCLADAGTEGGRALPSAEPSANYTARKRRGS